MEDKDILSLMPKKPPEGLLSWVKKKGGFSTQYLIYRVAYRRNPLTDIKEKMVEVTCTKCGEKSLTEYVASGGCCQSTALFGFIDGGGAAVTDSNSCICPCCKMPVKAAHIGRRFPLFDYEWPMTVSSKDGTALLCGWRMERGISKDGEVWYNANLYEGYAFCGKRAYRIAGHIKYITTDSLIEPVVRKRFCDNWGRSPLIYPMDKGTFDGTPMENAKLELYLKAAKEDAYPISYLQGYRKRPQVENLLMQGFGNLVAESVKDDCKLQQYYGCGSRQAWKFTGFNVNEKAPAKMLGVDKATANAIKAWAFTLDEVKLFCRIREAAQAVSPQQLKNIIKYDMHIWQLHEILNQNQPILKTVRYLQKQRLKAKNADWYMLKDWRQMALAHGMNLGDERIMWPTDLMREHDRMVELRNRQRAQAKAAKEEKEMKARETAFEELATQYEGISWEKGGICIRIAKTEAELLEEGICLNHCVGAYGESHCRGRSIFFVRRVDEPDKPWYTLQIDLKSGAQLQLHGKNNDEDTQVPKNVKEFCEEWRQQVLLPEQARLRKKKKITAVA